MFSVNSVFSVLNVLIWYCDLLCTIPKRAERGGLYGENERQATKVR